MSVRAAALLVLLLLVVVAPAFGQVAVGDDPSLWDRSIAFVFETQRQLHRDLAQSIRAVGAGTESTAALVLLSFLYGVFHAAGPGHGKAVMSAYLAAREDQVRRALWLSGAAALLQGVTAIVLVMGAIVLLGWTVADAQGLALWAERASYGLVALLGALLLVRAGRLLRFPVRANGDRHVHSHDDGHRHAHVHAVLPENLPQRWTETLGLIVAIGIRPCTGALLVLIFTIGLGLPRAGLLSVLAMSLGTGLALAAIALLVVKTKRVLALPLYARHRAATGIHAGACLVLGLALVAFGASLFMGSFGPAHPLF